MIKQEERAKVIFMLSENTVQKTCKFFNKIYNVKIFIVGFNEIPYRRVSR